MALNSWSCEGVRVLMSLHSLPAARQPGTKSDHRCKVNQALLISQLNPARRQFKGRVAGFPLHNTIHTPLILFFTSLEPQASHFPLTPLAMFCNNNKRWIQELSSRFHQYCFTNLTSSNCIMEINGRMYFLYSRYNSYFKNREYELIDNSFLPKSHI